MRAITSRRNPIVAPYHDAARGETPDALLLDGPHLVADALDAGLRFRHAVVRTGAEDEHEIAALIDRLARARIDVAPVSASVMAAISPLKSPSAIVALAGRPSTSPDRIYSGPAPLVAIAVGIQDPGNLGAIVRVAEAAGASGLVAAGACANPFGWKALRGSMGSALRLPIAVAADVDAALRDARAHRCRLVATVPRGGTSLFDGNYSGATAMLIGGEGPGLPAHVIGGADDRVTIPMSSTVESLNTAVAAALLLYEARRQRGQA